MALSWYTYRINTLHGQAAGEVAPLMITGVVKLAPALPLDVKRHFSFGSKVHAPWVPYLRCGFSITECRGR